MSNINIKLLIYLTINNDPSNSLKNANCIKF